MWRDETPPVRPWCLVHAGWAFVILPVPLGVQPGTFGSVLLGSCLHCAGFCGPAQTPAAGIGTARRVR